MRDCKKNQQKLYYATFIDKQPVYEMDENGDIVYITINGEQVPVEIGTTEATYSNPIEFHACISPSKGESESTVFGKNLDYDRTITTHDKTCRIDEYSHLWIDTMPVIAIDGTTTTKYNYEVKKVANSLNNTVIAIKKV